MFKKNMTPIGIHKKGTLHNAPNKGSAQRNLPGAAAGGAAPNFQDYGKATPMAQPDPTDAGQALGTGSFPGNALG